MTRETTVLNVRVSDELLEFLDSLVEKGFFTSRSEAVREFAREFVERMRNG